MYNKIMAKGRIKTAVLFSAIVGLGFLFYSLMPEEKNYNSLVIGGAELKVEIADTPQKRIDGLSGRQNLDQNKGMLFIFEKPDHYSFWMKNMKFPIDIIWIDENKKIIDITKNASQESYPERFSPKIPAKYVLEVNAGWADKHNVKIGSTFLLNH